VTTLPAPTTHPSPKFNISQDYRLGTNPTAVPDFDLAYIHGLFIRRQTWTELMI